MNAEPLPAHRRHLGHWCHLVMLVGLLVVTTITALIVVFLLVLDRDRTYSLSAVTETVSIVVRDPHGLSARVPAVSVLPSAEKPYELATLKVGNGSHVTLARKREGDLFATVDWPTNEAGSASLVTKEGAIVPLDSGASLRITLDRNAPWSSNARMPDSVLLAFRGEIRVGDDVAHLVERTLLSGHIMVVERQPLHPLFDERFVVYQAPLDRGDVVEWQQGHGSDPAQVAGFVHVGSGEALQVTAHAAADHVLVNRFGAAPYVLRPTFWDRVSRDPFVAGALSWIVVLAALFAFIDVLIKFWPETFKPKTKTLAESQTMAQISQFENADPSAVTTTRS